MNDKLTFHSALKAAGGGAVVRAYLYGAAVGAIVCASLLEYAADAPVWIGRLANTLVLISVFVLIDAGNKRDRAKFSQPDTRTTDQKLASADATRKYLPLLSAGFGLFVGIITAMFISNAPISGVTPGLAAIGGVVAGSLSAFFAYFQFGDAMTKYRKRLSMETKPTSADKAPE